MFLVVFLYVAIYCYNGVIMSVVMLLCEVNSTTSPPVPDNDAGHSAFIRARSFRTFKHEFRMEDACSFIKDGLGVCIYVWLDFWM